MSPTRDECIGEAGEVYGAILADPEMAAALARHRAAKRAEAATPQTATAEPTSTGEKPARRRTTRRKSA